MGLFKNKREKVYSYFVFGVYMILLVWLIMFKFATNIHYLPHMRGINLIPFYYDQENSVHLREILYNIMVFVPAGYYFTAIFSKKELLYGTCITAVLSLLFEVSQWVFAIGASDITDVITNTIGGLCGMIMFVVMGKLAPKNRMTIISTIGLVIEIVAIGFISMVFLMNN